MSNNIVFFTVMLPRGLGRDRTSRPEIDDLIGEYNPHLIHGLAYISNVIDLSFIILLQSKSFLEINMAGQNYANGLMQKIKESIRLR